MPLRFEQRDMHGSNSIHDEYHVIPARDHPGDGEHIPGEGRFAFGGQQARLDRRSLPDRRSLLGLLAACFALLQNDAILV